ncbi:TniQ family protein [Leptolyngbya sp. AN03gr2]|uniref:TniQ family protein n=1 Tax=unclassified Leptolyngbya TaxID=2650499 RepID=UPI003D31291A
MHNLVALEDVVIPARSLLHHLRLINIRHIYVESLSSHIIRLSESHSVYTGVLMEYVLAPLLQKTYGGAHLNKIYSHVCALNGVGTMAFDLVNVLESQTLHKELEFLTMLPWSEVVPVQSLMRSVRAWCPICYEEWRINRSVIYDPLLWTLDVVKICPVHRRSLDSVCPHCHHSNRLMSWRSRLGYCYKCEKWLGSLSSTPPTENKSQSETELEWLIWAANSVGELIATAPSMQFKPCRNRVAKGLSTCVKLFADGNVAEFSRLIQTPKNTVWLWCNGKTLPQLDALLKLCFRLKISVLDLLTQDEIEVVNDSIRLLPNTFFPSKHRGEIKFTNPHQIRSQLETVLLTQVAG